MPIPITLDQAKPFLIIYVAYVCCYFSRKNFPLLIPALDKEHYLTPEQCGLVASAYETTIAIVKFFCGPYVDGHKNPGRVLANTLLLSGCASLLLLASILFIENSIMRVAAVSLLWSINGAGQAVAWPALACVFLAWFPEPLTRGTMYSVLATNQNLGSTLAPKAIPTIEEHWGWRAGFYVPGVVTLGFGVVTFLFLKSQPPAKALITGSTPPSEKDEKEVKAKSQPKPSFVEAFYTLLSIRQFWHLCFAYIPIMWIRTSYATWTVMAFLASDLTKVDAASCITSLEIGAFFGSVLGGFISDKVAGGMRGRVMTVLSFMCAPVALVLSSGMDRGDMTTLTAMYFLIGFASFPPHSLIGLFSREICPKEIRTSAGCVAKAVGQIGAIMAGYPLILIAQTYGWGFIGLSNAIAAVMAGLIFMPLWNVKAEVIDPKAKSKGV